MSTYIVMPENAGTRKEFIETYGFPVSMDHPFVDPDKNDGMMVCLIEDIGYDDGPAIKIMDKDSYDSFNRVSKSTLRIEMGWETEWSPQRIWSMYIVPKSDLKKIGVKI